MPPTETIAVPRTVPEKLSAPPTPGQDRVGGLASLSRRQWYALLFLVGFLLRFGFMLWHKTYIIPPTATYETMSIAAHIADGKGFCCPFGIDNTGPSAWISPAYPYFVAAVYLLFGIYSATSTAVILTIQCLMAGVTGIGIYALGKRTLGERIGFWSAWIWTVSPFFFRWSTSWIWDMTASALLLTVALVVTFDLAKIGSTRIWLRLGVLSGIIALINPALLSVMAFTFLYGAIAIWRAKRPWFRGFVFSGLLFAGIIAPWLVRNEVVFHQPIFLRSNYWFEFHLGNYHYSNGRGFSGKHPTKNARELTKYKAVGEIQYVEQAKEDAFRFVREHPIEFANLTIFRTLWFWDGSFLSYETQEWWKPSEYWPLSAAGWLGLLFALTRRPRGWLLYAGPMLIYPIPYYIAWPSERYRHALEPLLLLLSVYLASVVSGELRIAMRSKKR